MRDYRKKLKNVALKRVKRMAVLREKGLSFQKIGNKYGVSKQRIHALLKKYGLLF